MLSENKDVVQSLKEHPLCFLLYLHKFQRLNLVNLNLYWTYGSVLSIKGLRRPRKPWYELPAGLQGPAIDAVSREKLRAISRLGIQEARKRLLITSGELEGR